MATVAKADVNEIYTEGQTFLFTDGTRQVTQAEQEALQRYMDNGGPVRIEFTEKKGKS